MRTTSLIGNRAPCFKCASSGRPFKNGIAMSRGIRQVPSWLAASDDEMKGDVISLPKRADVPFDINELFVVEVCSQAQAGFHAACEIDAGCEVVWLCTFDIASMIFLGPAA